MKKTSPQNLIIPAEKGTFNLSEQDVNRYLKVTKRDRVQIVFFGSDIWSIPVLQDLEDNFDVVAVVTAPNSPVSNYFKGLIFTPDKLDEEFSSQIKSFNSDLYIVASYGKIIPQSVLDLPKFGALNIHPSPLPKYRGPSPVPTTILNGDKKTGVTIIKMDAKMDHGPIVFTKEISLSGQEDSLTLLTKLFQLGGDCLVNIIPDFIAGKVILEPQNEDQAIYCKLLKKEAGFFAIGTPPSPEILDRMIRALNPWPGVWTKWNSKIVKFFPERKIQMEGKKILTFKDFLNGYPDFPIKEF